MTSHRDTYVRSASVRAIADAVNGGRVRALEQAEAALERLALVEPLAAMTHVAPEIARRAAANVDAQIASGRRLPLAGVPFVIKDNLFTADMPTRAASPALLGFDATRNATAVQQLLDAGAVPLGKANMHELAFGITSANGYFGAVRNPHDPARIAGGSSGGTACAVAAGIAFGLGTDTGGSIRQPASFAGVTGIKPTYGRVSRYGMIAFASSLDQGGPMARSAADCALLLNAMAGFDERDSTSLERADEDYTRHLGKAWAAGGDAGKPLAGLRIGLPAEYFGAGLADDVRAAIDAALKTYEALGATLVPVSLPKTELSIPVYYVIAPAEASSNLSRFDGVRYGHRAAEYRDLLDMYKKSRAEGFGPEVKRRILVGTYVLSHGYYDAYYLQAQKIRRIIAQDFQEAFKSCDVIMGPASPTVAWDIGAKGDDPVQMYLADIYTLSVSLAGLPGMSVPCGFGAGANAKRPVGLQIIGNYFDEARMLQVADAFQRATDWHVQEPAGV